MWVVALVGMATKLGEATLGLKYRQIDSDGKVSGGVFHYIEHGLGKRWKWLALIYAVLAGLAAFGIGNMVQANTMAHALETSVGLPHWVTGLLALILLAGVLAKEKVQYLKEMREQESRKDREDENPPPPII